MTIDQGNYPSTPQDKIHFTEPEQQQAPSSGPLPQQLQYNSLDLEVNKLVFEIFVDTCIRLDSGATLCLYLRKFSLRSQHITFINTVFKNFYKKPSYVRIGCL